MQRVEAWRKTTSRLLALESKGSVAGVEEELCDLVQELSGLYPVRDLQELVSCLRDLHAVSRS